jgi:predicted neutral ceramidase superfamily lipid hydrolase
MKTNIVWFNTVDYTPLQLWLFGIGAAFWVLSYVYIVRTIVKHKFVEMPAGVLCANITWEFLWAFVFTQNLGEAIGIGYKLWFFFDAYVVWQFYRYGDKQTVPSLKPYYKWVFTFALVAWFVAQYFYIKQGFDNPIGAHSAYIINILISLLYILLFLRLEDKSVLSFTAGWARGLGTGLISVMCFLKWPDNYWLITLCAICLLLDIFYVSLFKIFKLN